MLPVALNHIFITAKIIRNKYAVQRHEQTHIENRERKETCTICGLKLFNKTNLYSHMQTHKENREKRHKCEFCSKAFYEKGPLNIHRRIHLGQMIPCTLCSKQFFRQIDLERHMSSHSATAINTDTKKIVSCTEIIIFVYIFIKELFLIVEIFRTL